MTNRVVMGQRGGAYGLWVSKPGYNVLSAGPENMMLASDQPSFQIVASGSISNPSNGASYYFTIPNLGFTPLVLTSGPCVLGFSFPSSTSLRINAYNSLPYAPGSYDVHWAMTNQPVMI